MKPAIWRVHLNAVSPLISLFNSNHLTVDRTDADGSTIVRISKCAVTCNTLPGLGGKNATPRMRDGQQILPRRIESHCDQTANQKMFGLRHRRHLTTTLSDNRRR